MRAPTTDAEVQRAQDAYDRAAAEAARISRELADLLATMQRVDELVARASVALAEREYAWGVYVSTCRDQLDGRAA